MNTIFEESYYRFDFAGTLSEPKIADNPKTMQKDKDEFEKDFRTGLLPIKISMKFKDSLLKIFALQNDNKYVGKTIKYIFIIECAYYEKLIEREKEVFKQKISERIPTGLNKADQFSLKISRKIQVMNIKDFIDKYNFSVQKVN